VHADDTDLPLPERIALWLEQLTHVLPAQAPIRSFVHHNTLHGFQHLPFAEALATATELLGARTFWPEEMFRAAWAAGRITPDDLAAALEDAGPADLDAVLRAGLSRREILLASLRLPGEHGFYPWQVNEGLRVEDEVFARCRALTAGFSPPPENWRDKALQDWLALCQGVGQQHSLRGLLAHLSGEDVLEKVRTILQRHLAAHLDLGVAAWRNPARDRGFFAAWRESAGLDLAWELDELPSVRDEIVHLPEDPLTILASELPRLLPDDRLWFGYLQCLALELPGWSGMFLWRDRHPDGGDGTPVNMADYLAVRVLLERLLCDDLIRRLTGAPMAFDELCGYYAAEPAEFLVRDAWRRGDLPEDLLHRVGRLVIGEGAVDERDWQEVAEALAANRHAPVETAWRLRGLVDLLDVDPATLDEAGAATLLAEADRLTTAQRGYLWLLAYERHYREELLVALTANQARSAPALPVTAQAVLCMDDREEGTRRHLEEIAPGVQTFGAAGFFGVAMYWQGLDDRQRSALCPVVVQPQHLVRETARDEWAGERHALRHGQRLRWREHFVQGSRRHGLTGTLLAAIGALPALAALVGNSLAPGWFSEAVRRRRVAWEGAVPTDLELTAEQADTDATPLQPQQGFTVAEQVDRIEAFLRSIGLIDNFAPLVLMFGHGSASRNNPHLAAYDCGACSGQHGGPNARVFAAMANRPETRAGLATRGIVIPDSCRFVAAEHNTCDDSVEWYDLDQVPAGWQAALDVLVGQVAAACRSHALERCRRLASAPLGMSPWQAFAHVRARRHDLSQPRPELGHVNNAAAFVGRRQMSRGLFLDRRVFLISYDPAQDDADGHLLEAVLLQTVPVGAGIALEYYFSSVDNERFGCGSKITHNVTGLFAVMEGADSDLRTGLPWQMVEIHEPMRLLVVVEQTPEVLSAIVARQPVLRQLIDNAWIVLVAKNPDSDASTAGISQYCPRRGWLPWSGKAVLPQVAQSCDWFAGQRDVLSPALLLGAAT
jgi:uncharacterized protein YbcC (UPF0753/DUF2309 family)